MKFVSVMLLIFIVGCSGMKPTSQDGIDLKKSVVSQKRTAQEIQQVFEREKNEVFKLYSDTL